MTTANLRITPDDWRDATLSTSITEQTGFEAANTQNPIRGDVYRTADTTTVTITATWSASRTFSSLMIFNHLLHGANVRVQIGAYDSGALPALCYTTTGDGYTWSTGTKDPYKAQNPYWIYFDEVSASSAQVSFSGTPSAVSYFQVGRIILGRYKEFARSLRFGATSGRQGTGKSSRTDGGSRRGYGGASWPVIGGDLAGLNPSELAFWADFMNYADPATDFGFSLYPGDGDRKEAIHTLDAFITNRDVLDHEVGHFTGRIQVESA